MAHGTGPVVFFIAGEREASQLASRVLKRPYRVAGSPQLAWSLPSWPSSDRPNFTVFALLVARPVFQQGLGQSVVCGLAYQRPRRLRFPARAEVFCPSGTDA